MHSFLSTTKYTPNNYIFHQLFYTIFLCFNQYLIIMCQYPCISFITKNTSIHCKQKNAQIMIQNQVKVYICTIFEKYIRIYQHFYDIFHWLCKQCRDKILNILYFAHPYCRTNYGHHSISHFRLTRS